MSKVKPSDSSAEPYLSAPISPVYSQAHERSSFGAVIPSGNSVESHAQLPSPPCGLFALSGKKRKADAGEEDQDSFYRPLTKTRRVEHAGCAHAVPSFSGSDFTAVTDDGPVESGGQKKEPKRVSAGASEDIDHAGSVQSKVGLGDYQGAHSNQDDPVEHWIQNECSWSDYLKRPPMMDRARRPGSQKRSLSRSNSYTQSTRSGDTPRAWGATHAASMLEEGIYMERQDNVSVTTEDKELCEKIVNSDFALPQDWRFQKNNFSSIIKYSLYKNEAGVRDQLAPHLMPSAELHNAMGCPDVTDIAAELDTTWTKCTSLCGPRTRPDACYGISRLAFSREEREKLTTHETCTCGTMMFPFYICEAKCFSRSIEESELQALHGASVACSTIVKLYQRISAVQEVHNRILVFSMSHNQRLVKVFGHFALIDGDKVTYHRHRIFSTDLVDDVDDRTKAYQIARGIWTHFFPLHLVRIRHALEQQRERALESFTGSIALEEGLSAGVRMPSSSQDDDPIIRRLQEENGRLLSAMLQQQEEARLQRETHDKRMAEQSSELHELRTRHDAQMAEQKEVSRQQCILLEQQIQQQGEIIQLLKHTSA